MRFGDYRLEIVPDTEFRLDGGAMFGVVPRALWSKVCPPDEHNRIRMNVNCLFIEAGAERILVETGVGDKWSEKQAAMYGITRQRPLRDSVEAITGFKAEEITIVVNTHLHFDHAGGNTTLNEAGHAVPTFPNARYFVSRAEYEHAEAPHERDRASYLPENWRPVRESGQLELKEGEYEVVPGLRMETVAGHNRTMQCVRLERGDKTLFSFADLVPMRAHVPLPWIMGYDLYPVETLEAKKRLLPQAAREGWLCFFYHDPDVPLCRVVEEDGKLRAVGYEDKQDGFIPGELETRSQSFGESIEEYMTTAQIGIIGGSGLYQMPELKEIEEVSMETPFGSPSDAFIVGTLEGVRVAFLPRHGRGHRFTPTELPFRANIYAMKLLGVERILSASAVGSLQEQYAPLDMVIPDQFFDRTRARVHESTFFGDGIVAHVTFAHPVCDELGGVLEAACGVAGVKTHRGGTYLCMEGPAFSTKAESNVYRAWGMDVIGMTNLQEAKLAREAEICYATLALVTDYDCWHEAHDAVSVETVIEYLNKNVRNAQIIMREAVKRLNEKPRGCGCERALKNAIFTPRNLWPEATTKKLEAIIRKYSG